MLQEKKRIYRSRIHECDGCNFCIFSSLINCCLPFLFIVSQFNSQQCLLPSQSLYTTFQWGQRLLGCFLSYFRVASFIPWLENHFPLSTSLHEPKNLKVLSQKCRLDEAKLQLHTRSLSCLHCHVAKAHHSFSNVDKLVKVLHWLLTICSSVRICIIFYARHKL